MYGLYWYILPIVYKGALLGTNSLESLDMGKVGTKSLAVVENCAVLYFAKSELAEIVVVSLEDFIVCVRLIA